VPVWVSAPQAHSWVSNINFDISLRSVKGLGNTFDLMPKWSRTLPSLIYFSWDIYRDPPLHKKKSNIKVDI
jgi:hypothetical protein